MACTIPAGEREDNNHSRPAHHLKIVHAVVLRQARRHEKSGAARDGQDVHVTGEACPR